MPEPLKVTLPMEHLSARFEGAIDKENRTATLTFYSGATVRRHGFGSAFDLRFSMEPSAVRLERLNGAANLLDSHQDHGLASVLGVVERGWIENGKGKALVRFSKREEVQPVFEDVRDGVIVNASMGAILHRLKETSKEGDSIKSFVAVDWEPVEISLVAIPADPGAGFKCAEERQYEVEIEVEATASSGVVMPEGTLTAEAERTRVLEIQKIGRVAKISQGVVDRAVTKGTSLEEFRWVAIDEVARIGSEPGEIDGHLRLGRDGTETMRAAMLEALICRAQNKPPSELARPWYGRRLPDFAREICRAKGLDHFGSDSAVVTLALGTSDFPGLLSNFANKLLLQSYAAVPGGIRVICRQSTASDFKLQYKLRRGEYPQLLEVPENAEVKSGPVYEAKESYQVKTYGRIISLTRQSIINDDLGSFQTMTASIGTAAANFEAQFLVDLITANAGTGPRLDDGKPLFSSDHANVGTGAGSALSITALSSSRTAMRSQLGVDGVTLVDANPRYLLVPASLQTTAEALVATLYAGTIADQNPFANKLEVITEPRLDAKSATRWYLAADQASLPALEVAYLEGQPGPQILTRVGFEILGVETRVTLDYGAGAIDHRGIYSNPGV